MPQLSGILPDDQQNPSRMKCLFIPSLGTNCHCYFYIIKVSAFAVKKFVAKKNVPVIIGLSGLRLLYYAMRQHQIIDRHVS